MKRILWFFLLTKIALLLSLKSCCNNLRCNSFRACIATIFLSVHCSTFFSTQQFLHFSWRVIIKIIICFWLNSVGYFTLDLQMASDDLGDVSVGLLRLSWSLFNGFSCPKRLQLLHDEFRDLFRLSRRSEIFKIFKIFTIPERSQDLEVAKIWFRQTERSDSVLGFKNERNESFFSVQNWF